MDSLTLRNWMAEYRKTLWSSWLEKWGQLPKPALRCGSMKTDIHRWTLRGSQGLWRPFPSRPKDKGHSTAVSPTPTSSLGHFRTIPIAPLHFSLLARASNIYPRLCLLLGVDLLASVHGWWQTLLPKTGGLNDLTEENRKGSESNHPKILCAPMGASPEFQGHGRQCSLPLRICPVYGLQTCLRNIGTSPRPSGRQWSWESG